jgi:large conductance mechanosensitive channel
MKEFIAEFKAFAIKGNVIDLAVAVVVGAAFGKIVSSLVDNIIMPVVGILLGGINFTHLAIHIGDAVIFMVVRVISRLQKKEAATPAPKEPSAEVKLLTEIRDSLRRN